MFTGKVKPEDDPSSLVLQNAGMHAGDSVKFFVERERTGTVERDNKGELLSTGFISC